MRLQIRRWRDSPSPSFVVKEVGAPTSPEHEGKALTSRFDAAESGFGAPTYGLRQVDDTSVTAAWILGGSVYVGTMAATQSDGDGWIRCPLSISTILSGSYNDDHWEEVACGHGREAAWIRHGGGCGCQGEARQQGVAIGDGACPHWQHIEVVPANDCGRPP
jgi:hypothetical protein